MSHGRNLSKLKGAVEMLDKRTDQTRFVSSFVDIRKIPESKASKLSN
jgi:hypothetical protein